MTTEPSLLATVTAARDKREAGLNTLAGNRALCRIPQDGDAMPVKVAEGAVAALSEGVRAVRAGGGWPELAQLQAKWHRKLAGRMASSLPWKSYFTGGVDALDELLADRP